MFILCFFFLSLCIYILYFFFFFQAEDGIRDRDVTGVQTCALPILPEMLFGQLMTSSNYNSRKKFRGIGAKITNLFSTQFTVETTDTTQKKRYIQTRSEEHTSELQSHHDLVCRLLLEKKKKKRKNIR